MSSKGPNRRGSGGTKPSGKAASQKTPGKTASQGSSSASSSSSGRLRMPPIIDHTPPHWADNIRQFWQARPRLASLGDLFSTPASRTPQTSKFGGGAGQTQSQSPHGVKRIRLGAHRFMRSAVYQTGLIGLLAATLCLVVLAALEMRKFTFPDLSVPQISMPKISMPKISVPQISPTETSPWGRLPDGAGGQNIEKTRLPEKPADKNRDDNLTDTPPIDMSDLPAPSLYKETRPSEPSVISEPSDAVAELNAQLAAMTRKLAAERTAHGQTQTRLGAAIKSAKQAQLATSQSGTIKADNLRRALMAEWLVRLQTGLPFDDLLAEGEVGSLSLQSLLTRREIAAFSLLAANGLPTQAVLQTQLVKLAKLQNEAIEALPLTDNEQSSLHRWLHWLAARSGGLVSLSTEAPLASAPQLAALGQALGESDYPLAAIELQRMILRWETAQQRADTRRLSENITVALHDLYADVQSLAEVTPMMRAIQADFIAGVRP